MRILHIIATMDPKSGGPAELIRGLLTTPLPDLQSEVLTLDDPANYFLDVFDFTVHAIGPAAGVYGYTPSLIPWLKNNADRFDGFIVHGMWQFLGLAALWALPQSKPYAIFSHGMLDPYFKRRFPMKHLKKTIYWLLVEYWVLRRARFVIFTTRSEQALAQESFPIYRWNPIVIPLGGASPPENYEGQINMFSSLYPSVPIGRFLLFLGRIHPKKGCDLLIEALKNVAAESDLHLVIAGPDDSNWSFALQSRAKDLDIFDRIHWTGMLSGDAKWGAYRSCEAFVLPSHQENFGIAVIEAMSCGKPVLISDKVNIASEVIIDKCGFVEVDSEKGVEKLLRRWFQTPPREREDMANNAIVSFKRRYDLVNSAKSIAGLFRK